MNYSFITHFTHLHPKLLNTCFKYIGVYLFFKFMIRSVSGVKKMLSNKKINNYLNKNEKNCVIFIFPDLDFNFINNHKYIYEIIKQNLKIILIDVETKLNVMEKIKNYLKIKYNFENIFLEILQINNYNNVNFSNINILKMYNFSIIHFNIDDNNSNFNFQFSLNNIYQTLLILKLIINKILSQKGKSQLICRTMLKGKKQTKTSLFYNSFFKMLQSDYTSKIDII